MNLVVFADPVTAVASMPPVTRVCLLNLATFTRALITLCLLLTVTATASAQEAQAYLSQSEVAVGGQFVLNLEISGTQQLDEDPVLPDLSAFAAFVGSGSSTSMQLVGGRTSVSLTIQYHYQTTATGTFEIGPISLSTGGQDLVTEPLTVRVTDAPQRTPRGDRRGRNDVTGPEDLFVTTTVSKRRVYVNEPIVVEYRLFTRVEVTGYTVTDLPSASGFWVEELTPPQDGTRQVLRDGVRYATVLLRRVALFPTSTGAKTIEPLTLEAQVRVQRRSRSFFNDPFFGSRVPVVVGSESIELEVLPLPPGQPPEFTGLVGQLEVNASMDRTEVATNEALTYRVEISGTGNIRTLTEPGLAFPPDFEVYPPEVTERVESVPFVATIQSGAGDETAGNPDSGIRGYKTFEYVVVPRAPGRVTIPAVDLSYFHGDRITYAIASSNPIAVTIGGDPLAAPDASPRRRRTGLDLEREDVRFIRTAAHPFSAIGASLWHGTAFWLTLLLPLIAVAGAVTTRRHRDHLQKNVAYARRRRASKMTHRRLATAQSVRSPERAREFYTEVGRALQGFLADTLNLAEAGIMRDDVRARLVARGATEAAVDAYLDCLEDCDRWRFSPTETPAAPEPNQTTEDVMQQTLTRAEEALTALDTCIR